MTFSGSSLETHSICHAPSHGHIHDDVSWSWAVFIPAARHFLSIKANPPGLGNFHCKFFLPIMLSVSKNFFLFPKCPCSMNEMSVTFEFVFFFLSHGLAYSPEKSFPVSYFVCVRWGIRLAASIWEERELRVSASSISSVYPSFQRPSPENKPSVSTKVGIWGLFLKNTSTSFLRAPWTCSSRDILGHQFKSAWKFWWLPRELSPLSTMSTMIC